jgi:hypothetical protein
MSRCFPAILAIAVLLSACGGGGSAPTTAAANSASIPADATGTLSLFVTDNLTESYSEVWVTLLSVSATDDDGQSVELFNQTDGIVVNLAALVNIGALLDTRDLPAGAYNNLAVELSNAISLVAPAGAVTDAAFALSGETFSVAVDGEFAIDADKASAIALDFDLQQFDYDAETGLVTPVVVLKNDAAVRDMDSRVADIEGRVVEIVSRNEFSVQLEHCAQTLDIVLHADAVVTDELSGDTVADTSTLNAGMRVKVFGNYDTDNLTLEARFVEIRKNENKDPGDREKVEGRIVSYDGTAITLDVRKASFIPGVDTMTIVNVTNAVFSHGSLAMLNASGQWVEIKGRWDGTVFSAQLIDIEGAPGAGRLKNGQSVYGEIEGRVVDVADETIAVEVTEVEHIEFTATTITVELHNVWLNNGSLDCLQPEMHVELKGVLVNDAFQTYVVELAEACNSGAASDGETAVDTQPTSREVAPALPLLNARPVDVTQIVEF